ncbi:hypothetical protein [Sphingomonas mucosissima]|uniref:Uncharacterized protein n=1 Tax=Sphingomonas mucosissima TaxID=370959 RepID=A0A245ZE28_9SPHN|nr:hypothetical protein [Sphingomonas mucosissima]OWK27973.1 hypothetical protein SPMU_32180 [Sphingomonas mucosissima]
MKERSRSPTVSGLSANQGIVHLEVLPGALALQLVPPEPAEVQCTRAEGLPRSALEAAPATGRRTPLMVPRLGAPGRTPFLSGHMVLCDHIAPAASVPDCASASALKSDTATTATINPIHLMFVPVRDGGFDVLGMDRRANQGAG